VTISCLPSEGIVLPGKIRDLSLGGCCVDTTLPIARGARAELFVRVNAASFRAVGEVRAIRSHSGACLEFVQLSAGGKGVLADLVRELARLQAVMNDIKSTRREIDPEAFRRQLDYRKLQAQAEQAVSLAGDTAAGAEFGSRFGAGRRGIERIRARKSGSRWVPSIYSVRRNLNRHQHHATGYQQGCNPTPAPYALVQEDARGQHIRHKGERGRSRYDQAEVSPREAKEQAVERDPHRHNAERKRGCGKHAANHRQQPAPL